MTVEFLGARYGGRGGNFIRPASAFDEAKLGTVPQGRAIAVTVTWPVNAKARAFYHALTAKLAEVGLYATKEEADFDLRIKAGRAESMILTYWPDGAVKEMRFTPASSRDWDGADWRAFLDEVIRVVATDLIPEIRTGEWRTEIERFCGARLRDALSEENDG